MHTIFGPLNAKFWDIPTPLKKMLLPKNVGYEQFWVTTNLSPNKECVVQKILLQKSCLSVELWV